MQADLIIRYKHEQTADKEHVCTGEMFYRSLDGGFAPFRYWEFDKQPFKKLLIEASNRLNKDTSVDVAKVIIERTDRPGLRPVIMDHPTQEILKTDPVIAIRLLSYEGSAVRGDARTRTSPPPMRSGYDTLSESIGEEVYCRQNKGMVECPGCGMWSTVHTSPFTCKKKRDVLGVDVVFTETWAKFKVADLLRLGLPRYFIPREFNATRPWITWEALNALYETWRQVANQQEKAS